MPSADKTHVTEKPRILVVGPTPPPHNGMTQATVNLVSSRLQEKYNFVLLDTSDRRGLQNIGLLDVGNVWLAFVHAAKLLQLMLTQSPQVVLVPIAQSRLGLLRDLLFLIPARVLRRRVIIALHGGAFRDYYNGETRWMQTLLRFGLEKASAAIVLGNCFRSIFGEIIPNDRIFVVPNGLNLSGLGLNVQKNGPPRVLFLSTLGKLKGFVEVLHAVPEVQEKFPAVQFVFAGEVYDRQLFEEATLFVREQNLGNTVHFAGPVTGDAKLNLFHQADVFVFPPTAPEGHPFVILEAMAAGLPIITTAQGAIPETVIESVNAFFVPTEDSDAIAERVNLLLGDIALRKRMGRANQERFLSEYSLDCWIERMERVFDFALESKG